MTADTPFIPDLPPDLAPLTRRQVPLRDLTTLRVGGPAGLVCRLTTPEAALRFHRWVENSGLPFYILGAGSNVLAPDDGFAGVILKVETSDFSVTGNLVTAGAGLDFDSLIAQSLNAGLVGLEFASGIPGTLGGAVMGNAGCYGHEIGEFVRTARLLTPEGHIEEVGADEFGFAYRLTQLRETGAVLLDVTLAMCAGDGDQAMAVRHERIADRRAKHPVDQACAGSWFRNLPAASPDDRRQAAGRLLEAAGAKAMHEGDARVFERHANIIVNAGRATSDQISRLAARMQAAVRDRFKVELVEEVRRFPQTPA